MTKYHQDLNLRPLRLLIKYNVYNPYSDFSCCFRLSIVLVFLVYNKIDKQSFAPLTDLKLTHKALAF